MAVSMYIITVAALVIFNVGLSHALCSDDVGAITKPIIVDEGTPADQLLLNITSRYPISLNQSNHPFLKLRNGSIFTKVNLSLDGQANKDLCSTILPVSTIIVRCDTMSFSALVTVEVSFTDDYFPELLGTIKAHVKEGAPPGTLVVDMSDKNYTVTDEDCNTGGFFYYMDDSDPVFQLKSSLLTLKQEVDFESQQEYYFNITVASNIVNGPYKDAKEPTLVHVFVDDVDDKAPEFNSTQYSLHVKENDHSMSWRETSPPLLARDGDVGLDVPVIYSLYSVQPYLDMDIDNMTGKILIRSPLDRENVPMYTTIIKAEQVDKATMSATATLSIFVDDVNDNRPMFRSPPPGFTIREDMPTGTYLIPLDAKDDDEGENAKFDYNIKSDSLGAFEVKKDSVTGGAWIVVRDGQALRNQTWGQVQIVLNETQPAEDSDSCDYITTCVAFINVTVVDVNDNTPVFKESQYDVSIFSNHSGGSVAFTVQAEDADKGDNGKIEYSLEHITASEECKKLKMEPSTGAVTLQQPMVAGVECSLIAKACDSPSDLSLRRCSMVPVLLVVIHGGAAVEQNVTVPENLPKGTAVTVLPSKGLVSKSLDFEAKEDVLYTKTTLDRETKDNYRVEIFTQANDILTMILHVYVDDVNDNPPVFKYKIYVINLDDNVKLGKVVLQVDAEDKDKGKNSVLTYSLRSGREWFSIDPSTGEITMLGYPTIVGSSSGNSNNGNNNNNNQSVDFTLQVADGGSPSLQGFATLRIYFPSFNETAVVFLPTPRDELLADVKKVEDKLSDILAVSTRVLSIEDIGSVAEMGSRVYISATNTSGAEVTPTQLNSLLEQHAEEIHKSFLKLSQAGGAEDGDDDEVFTLPVIILIAVGGFLLLVVIIISVLFWRQHKKLKQNVSLFDKLNKDTTIYDSVRKPSEGATTAVNNNKSNNNYYNTVAVGSITERSSPLSNGSARHDSITRESDGTTPNHVFENPGFSQQEGASRVVIQNGVSQHSNAVSPTIAQTQQSSPHEADDIDGDGSIENDDDRVTRFGSDGVTTINQPVHVTTIDVKHFPRLSTASETQSTGPEGNRSDVSALSVTDSSTPRSDRLSSEADSGLGPSDKENMADDEETDKEVAHILTNASQGTNSEIGGSNDNEDRIDNTAVTTGNLDLMRPALRPPTPPISSSGVDTGDDNRPDEDSSPPDEPEPDYAKRVRFSEATSVMVTSKEDDQDMGHGKANNETGQERLGESPPVEIVMPNDMYMTGDEITPL